MRGLVIVLVTATLLAFCRAEKVCIVGSGIGGASVSFFLRNYSSKPLEIEIYEKLDRVGGRLAQVQLGDDIFEAGGSIIAEKNRHMREFTELLGLTRQKAEDDDNFGIWNGRKIFFQTVAPGGTYVSKKFTSLWNSLLLFHRYGMSLMKMEAHVSDMLEKWMKFYDEEFPVYDTVESLLKSVDLYEPTQHTLQEGLFARGLSERLIDELITFIMRINYGQNTSISGLAGAVSLAGSGDDLWNVQEGNDKVPAGLIKYTNASLHLSEAVLSVAYDEGSYRVGLGSGQSSNCDAVVIATPLDEEHISFSPKLDIPKRSSQHTYATFVRGLINSDYFGAATAADVPSLIGTVEDPLLPFSSISVLKSYSAVDKAYKVFSRTALTDAILDQLFRTRSQTIQINWAAYPHYTSPEKFAPIILDGHHLYYVNTFESAASAMEASTVAAKNVARLLLSRISGGLLAQVVKRPIREESAEL